MHLRSCDGVRAALLRLLLAGAILVSWGFAAPPANASWSGYAGGQNCVPSGVTIGGICETLVDACES